MMVENSDPVFDWMIDVGIVNGDDYVTDPADDTDDLDQDTDE